MPAEDRPLAEESSRDVGALIRLTLAGVLLLMLAAFAIDNRGSVRVGWVFGDVRAPMILILLITAVVGAVIGWLVLYRARRAGRRNQRDDEN